MGSPTSALSFEREAARKRLSELRSQALDMFGVLDELWKAAAAALEGTHELGGVDIEQFGDVVRPVLDEIAKDFHTAAARLEHGFLLEESKP